MFVLKGFSDFLQKVLKLIFEKKQQIPWLCGINDMRILCVCDDGIGMLQ